MFHHDHAYKLDDPERQRWLPVADLLARLDLRPGLVVADIGAGSGYFTLPLARAVTPGGRVVAIDVQPEMLALIAAKLATPPSSPPPASHEAAPIELVEGEASRTTLAGASVDRVFIANVWHEIDDLPATLREIARILRPGGRLFILDWRKDVPEGEVPGPPMAHRIAEADVVELLGSQQDFRAASSEHVGAFSYLVGATRA